MSEQTISPSTIMGIVEHEPKLREAFDRSAFFHAAVTVGVETARHGRGDADVLEAILMVMVEQCQAYEELRARAVEAEERRGARFLT